MPKLRRSPRLAGLNRVKQPKINLQAPPRRSARLAAKKRGKPNTKFIRHRPTILDKLPMDIISDFIFPSLDYESRINLNQCLPIWDRIPKKMEKRSVTKHDMQFRIDIIRNILVKLYTRHTCKITGTNILTYTGNSRIHLMIDLFKNFQNDLYLDLLIHYPRLRKVVLEKLDEFELGISNKECDCSEDNINSLVSEIKTLRNIIDNKKTHFYNKPPFILENIQSLSFI